MQWNRLMVVLAAAVLAVCEGGVSVGAGLGVSANASSRTTGSDLVVTMHKIDAKGVGEEIGTLMLADTDQGLRIEAALNGLPPGDRGFHLHEKASCDPGVKDGKTAAGIGAGNHFDPNATGKHLGPQGSGHRGDLPVLHVDENGAATGTVFAPHLKLADVRGKSLMIHAGGDNYSDKPEPLGGGGGRIACGVVN
jgi:superoxide dismutase, Cu-Zn family